MAAQVESAFDKIDRSPASIGGCFCWLHSPPLSHAAETAVVLCSGIGRDSSTGHRPLRFLADHIALSGYPVLRLGYPGVGDSRDLEDEAVWDTWVNSVHAAVDHATQMTGARNVVLIGLRLGAQLAAMAASTRDVVTGLILVEPVVRGGSFVTQLRIEERLAVDAAADDGAVRVHGLDLSQEALGHIARLDLRAVTLRDAARVMMLTEHPSALVRQLEATWRRQGAEVAYEVGADTAAFLRPTHLPDEPFPDVRPVLAWLGKRFPAERRVALAAVPPPELRGAGWRELPLVFGSGQSLFGMLCQPDDDEPRDQIVIFGNTGGDPHDGFARFGVELARFLARRGIASLRFDFAGLGDSLNPDHDPAGLTHPFAVDRRADFAAAIDVAVSRGYRSIALQGLCSGAYHAFQAAAADPRVRVLLCINLPWFNLRYQKAGPGSFARVTMQTLCARHVRCGFLFAENDTGLAAVTQHFGKNGQDLATLPDVALSISQVIDHDLTRPEMRRVAADWMLRTLRADAGTVGPDGQQAGAAAPLMPHPRSPSQHLATEEAF